MSRDQAKIIINPVASGGKVGTRWPELRQSLVKLGLQFDFELTSHRGISSAMAATAR
jgi:hypothetical protein